ncbi:MAG: hypothetical protein P8Y54_10670 [Xanthomonadales bacterium]
MNANKPDSLNKEPEHECCREHGQQRCRDGHGHAHGHHHEPGHECCGGRRRREGRCARNQGG